MSSEPVSQSHLTAFVQVGMRVVLRSRLPDADITPGGPTLTDVVGDVLSLDEEAITVATRRGEATVARAGVVAAKRVPPPPPRRRPRHTEGIGIDDLQALMTAGMPPLHSHRIGSWLLRAADGYTGRANSALPVGNPGMPLEEAIEQVMTWYAGHGQPALIQLPYPATAAPHETALGSRLAQRNWRFFMRTLVMTKASADLNMTGAVRIDVRDEPTDDWWRTASPRSIQHRETLDKVLALIPDAAYLTAYRGETPVGHARSAFADGWSGVFDVHTEPEARRAGVARALMAGAEQAAYDRRNALQYLQVAANNTAAVRLYESLGWQVHHAYHYARPASDV